MNETRSQFTTGLTIIVMALSSIFVHTCFSTLSQTGAFVSVASGVLDAAVALLISLLPADGSAIVSAAESSAMPLSTISCFTVVPKATNSFLSTLSVFSKSIFFGMVADVAFVVVCVMVMVS